MKLLAFLFRTTDRLVSRIVLNSLFAGVVAAGVTLLVAAEGTRHWPPDQLTFVAMAIIAGFAAYATGVTVLLRAAARRLVQTAAVAPPVEPVIGPGDHGQPTDRTAETVDSRRGTR